MGRDIRLTGSLRGQTDNYKAPLGFELNNPWKVSDKLQGTCTTECLANSSINSWRRDSLRCILLLYYVPVYKFQ